jgi:GT2 family glycosyltransferase
MLIARPTGSLSWWEALRACLASGHPRPCLVVASGEPGSVPEQVLVDLLSGPFGIGAVTPLLYDARGRVVEAGTYLDAGGTVNPFGAGSQLGAPELSFRRDVPGSGSPVVAIAPAAWEGFEPGPASTLADLLAHVQTKGLRIVYEPSWHVRVPATIPVGHAPGGPRRWAQRDRSTPTRVLVVTGMVPGVRVGADGLGHLTEVLARCPATRVTLACADGFGSRQHAARFQQQGVEVVAGPLDWLAWCADRRYHYSHLVASDEGLTTALWSLARDTQPQAMAVVYSEGLPFRRNLALGEQARHHDGWETVVATAQARLLRHFEGIDVAWCPSAADAQLMAGLLPAVAVHSFWPALAPRRAGKGFADRDGVVVVATDGYDLATGAEDAAVRVLSELVPAWRRWDRSLSVKVIADWPTAGLAHLCRDVIGAELVPSGGNLVDLLSRARVAIASTTAALPEALAAGAALLVTPEVVGGLDLSGLSDQVVVADLAVMRHRAWALLNDEDAWEAAAAATAASVEALLERRDAAMRAALLQAGLDAPEGRLYPVGELDKRLAAPARPPVLVPLRPPQVADPPAIFLSDSLSEDQRYALWDERRGPSNPEVVAAIGAEAARAGYQPLISVLMPVCDTEPWMLEAAIGSLLDQAYPNWQLCLADDGSTRRGTLAALEGAAERDPRVVLTSLQERSGISAATNAALGLARGDYVAFLDHDDLLKPHALAQVVRWLDADPSLDLLYSDEDKLDPAGRLTEARWKPDWSPNLLLCQNYVCHLLVVRRSLLEDLGGLRSAFDGSQDYDLVLRISEVTDRIAHIPDVLYSWRQHESSAAAAGDHKPWAWMAAQRALRDWLRRRERAGQGGGWTEEGAWEDVHRVRFKLPGRPKVSVLISTRNGRGLLERCVNSVVERSTYDNFELVVVDNQSDDQATLEYLSAFPGRVVRFPHEFNFARQVNLSVAAVETDALLFLNNDTEVRTADWIERLLEHAMRPEVGAVGPRLYLPNGDVQHEGIIVGAWRGHANSIEWGNWWRMGDLLRDVSAVTGACMMTRPGVFWRLGGFDERLRVAYNDVDYCLRLHQAGYQVVYVPDAHLYHAEGSTRGRVEDPEDAPLFNERWRPRSSCDPYYNPNLNRNRLLFRVEP